MTNDPHQSAQSDINEAFEALRREVSLTRHAVEGLTAVRERIPDYSTPLGQIIDALKRTLASLDRIEKSPAAQLTPEAMALKIHQASATVRADDVRLIRETRDAMVRSVAMMDQIVERGRAAREQGDNLSMLRLAVFYLHSCCCWHWSDSKAPSLQMLRLLARPR